MKITSENQTIHFEKAWNSKWDLVDSLTISFSIVIIFFFLVIVSCIMKRREPPSSCSVCYIQHLPAPTHLFLPRFCCAWWKCFLSLTMAYLFQWDDFIKFIVSSSFRLEFRQLIHSQGSHGWFLRMDLMDFLFLFLPVFNRHCSQYLFKCFRLPVLLPVVWVLMRFLWSSVLMRFGDSLRISKHEHAASNCSVV